MGLKNLLTNRKSYGILNMKEAKENAKKPERTLGTMKINVKLTADELMNVVDAAMDEAIDRGYDPDDEEVVEDMLNIVDAALAAMGIEVIEDVDEDEDEDEDYDEWDEDEDEDEEEVPATKSPVGELLVEVNGKMFLRESDAQVLLDFMRKTVYEKFNFLPVEKREVVLCKMWCKFGEDFGIYGVLKGE